MNLSGKTVTFLKLHAPLFIPGVGQTGNTIEVGRTATEGLKNIKMTVTDQGILLQTTGKQPGGKLVSVLLTTYESAIIEMSAEEAPKVVKK